VTTAISDEAATSLHDFSPVTRSFDFWSASSSQPHCTLGPCIPLYPRFRDHVIRRLLGSNSISIETPPSLPFLSFNTSPFTSLQVTLELFTFPPQSASPLLWDPHLLQIVISLYGFASCRHRPIGRSNTRYQVLCSLAILWKYRPYLDYGGPKFEKSIRAESKECA
jgi:hypothetical protein